MSQETSDLILTYIGFEVLCAIERRVEVLFEMNRRSKRIFDLALSVLGLFLLAPVLMLTGLAIWLEDGRPILFRQRRALARGGKEFEILKFRTMKKQAQFADPTQTAIAHAPAVHHIHSGAEVTRVGSIIRKLRIDELPQLMNVLRGEMSLVGPRPLALEDLKKVNDFATDDQVGQSATSSVPGLTGIWQLYRSGDDHYEDKVWMDRFYFEHQSWKLDLDLLAKTFLVVLFGRKQSWQRKLAKKNSRVTRNERS